MQPNYLHARFRGPRRLLVVYLAYGLGPLAALTAGAIVTSREMATSQAVANQVLLFALGLAGAIALATLVGLLILRRALGSEAEAESARRQAEGHLRVIFENSALGICTVGLDGRIKTANPALETMLGEEGRPLPGQSYRALTHPDDVPDSDRMYQRIQRGEVDSLSIDKRYRRTDGSEFWASVTVSGFRGEDGQLQYFVSLVEDIQTRKEATEQLQKLSNDKSHFVSMVSHEFRNALTGIRGFSETIRDEALSPDDVHDFANEINREAQRMSRMISELLDLERMESGRAQLRRAPLDLAELGSAALTRAQATTDRHHFRVVASDNLRPLEGDVDKITQVLANLLGNAVKYSPEGGEVLLTIAAGPGGAEVSVSDHGLGIPAADLGRVFERYHRVESGEHRYIEGTGLGLPIVKSIVELHGGRVGVASREGEGSTFTFEIPWPAN